MVVPVVLSGCQSQPTATPDLTAANSTAEKTAEKRSIKVNPSWLLQGDNAPLTIAVQNGYFSSKGLDVKIERGFGSADTLAKVASGQFEIGFGDLSTASRIDLEEEKVLVNIHKYGNTTSGTLPLLLWDFEHKFKKGDNLIFAAFGGGFTWGSIYLKWAYDSK